MRRLVLALVSLLLAGVVLPPLWYTVFPVETPTLPAAGRRVDLGGGVGVNVVEAGAGPPVVLVHGFPGTAYDWRETSSALTERGRRALAYDRVGWGRSDPRTRGPYTLEQNALELTGLLVALELEDATVVGWSYGGAVALLAAMGDTGRIGRLVLVGTAGPDSAEAERTPPPLAMRLLNSMPALRWRRAVPPVGRGLIRALTDVAFSDGPVADWWLPGVYANFARLETLETYQGEFEGVEPGGPAAWDEARIRVPTLLVHGDDDRLAPIATSRYLAVSIPGAELLEVAGGSHMLPVTHAELLAERIVAFSGGADPGV